MLKVNGVRILTTLRTCKEVTASYSVILLARLL